MQANIIEDIKALYSDWDGDTAPITSVEKIPQSGSNRMYFRVLNGKRSYIATYNDNIRENRTFVHFSNHFRAKGCPVPEIYAVNDAYTIYLQEDFGDLSLLGELERQGHNEPVYALFRQSLQALARLQILGDEGLDYSWTITSREFGKQAILSDLLYRSEEHTSELQSPC